SRQLLRRHARACATDRSKGVVQAAASVARREAQNFCGSESRASAVDVQRASAQPGRQFGPQDRVMTETSASILIVDDDEAICKLLSVCLEPTYSCAAAATAQEAISLLEAGSFKLVMSDIKMPGRSGLELCQYIQQNFPRTVVIMMSGMTDIQCSIGAMRRGAFDYVTKPFDLAELTLAVDRALRYQQ